MEPTNETPPRPLAEIERDYGATVAAMGDLQVVIQVKQLEHGALMRRALALSSEAHRAREAAMAAKEVA
jgi:hypothetical protein